MKVERLSNAWLYPAICHPVFKSSVIAGSLVAAGAIAGETAMAIPAKTIRQNAVRRSPCMLDVAPALLQKVQPFGGTLFGSLYCGECQPPPERHAIRFKVILRM